jgi:hemolysin activation/secretion protein
MGMVATSSASAMSRAADEGGAAATPPATTAQASEDHFPILEFRVLNNSVLGPRQIERAVYLHLGPSGSFSDVQAARADLEKAYRDAGYSTVYVDIPEQSVASGIVRLAVTEGRLEKVAVRGTRYFMNRRILAAVPSLEPGTVPHFPDVQQQLSALNQASPDLSVAPILKPGTTPGTVDVDLKVKDTLPFHASAEINNRYTANTSPTRVNLNASYDNLFQSYQTLSLQYQTAPDHPSDSRVIAATYLAPIAGSGGATMAFYAIKTDSDVATVGTLAVLGKGHVYGTRYIMPLTPSGSLVPTLTFGADLKNFDENVLLASGPGLQTPIKYLNWSAAYALSASRDHITSSITFGTNFGIRGLLNDPAEFESKRYGAKPDYMYWHVDASQVRPLPLSMEIAMRMSGQYTVEPLIDNEQFAIGGVESVRGYLEAEDLGDQGIDGSVELRSPHLATLFGVHPREAYVYAFYDAAVVRLLEPLPSQIAHQDLRGWGLGFRVIGLAGFDAGLDWAHSMVATTYESADGTRFQFHFRYGF